MRADTSGLRITATLSLLLLASACPGDEAPATAADASDGGLDGDGGDTAGDAVTDVAGEIAAGTRVLASESLGAEPEAGAAFPVAFFVRDDAGAGVAGVEVSVTVSRGAGTLTGGDPYVALTGADGRVEAPWVLGAAPVRQALRATAGTLEVEHRVVGAVAESVAPAPLFDLDTFLAAEGIEGSTEDLAFSDEGELYLGVPGGFVVADSEGELRLLETSGDEIGRPLGMAFDAEGNLWAADADRLALLRVSPVGEVSTALTTNGAAALVGPNYVAIGRAGEVFLTDPCLGEVIVYEPGTQAVSAVYSFDVPTQGGPNGVALDASGDWLYVATENPALFCTIPGLVFNERVGGVYRIALTGEAAGTIEPIVEGVALFGDGLAFDAEGNLWVVLTNNAGLTLGESGVWVLPEGGSVLQPYLALEDAIVANVAFGVAPFDEATFYMAMLAVPGFTREETRGLRSHPVGLTGLPLR